MIGIEANLFFYVLADFDSKDMSKFPWICFKVESVYWWQIMRWETLSATGNKFVPKVERKASTILYETLASVSIYTSIYWFVLVSNVAFSDICIKRGWSQNPYATSALHYYTGRFLLTQTQIYNNNNISAFLLNDRLLQESEDGMSQWM